MALQYREFIKGEDRLFESVLGLAIMNEAFFCHLMASTGNTPPKPGSMIGMSSMQDKTILSFPVSLSFGNVVLKDMATSIFIHFVNPPGMEYGTLPVDSGEGTMARALLRLVSPLFLQFYETYLPWWVKKYSGDPTQWPEVMRFGRVVRNAIGHGSRIMWASPNVPPVTWSGLKYSHADNGRAVIGHDLVSGDLVRLMIAISDKLDAAGCPIDI